MQLILSISGVKWWGMIKSILFFFESLLYKTYRQLSVVLVKLFVTAVIVGIALVYLYQHRESVEKYYYLRMNAEKTDILSGISLKDGIPIYKKSTGNEVSMKVDSPLKHYYLFGASNAGRSMVGLTNNYRDISGWIDDKDLFFWETRRVLWPKKNSTVSCSDFTLKEQEGEAERAPSDFGLLLRNVKEWHHRPVYEVAYLQPTHDPSSPKAFFGAINCETTNADQLQIFLFMEQSDFVSRIQTSESLIKSLGKEKSTQRHTMNFLTNKVIRQKQYLSVQENWSGIPKVGIVPIELI